MSKSPSSAPRLPVAESSTGPSSSKRPKYLGRESHSTNLKESGERAIAPKQALTGNAASQSEPFDSSNFEAARRLMQEREEIGLTLEEAAAVAKVSMTTVWRRENNLVDLGPLKQLVALEKARGLKKIK